MELSPLLILAIGIATVIGMIIVLRINAFIALITAAMLVSLMAPGATSEKISRVAEAFGRYAGSIGIVIALAAVIGKCMMDSGAADRVVRAFLGLLGEKRASFALMGSGFVLAVPVFFDTVFYLLVPLARSLHKRTAKNYLMYILAIAAGGAITHTLVPPTPGPLLMAANLGIDIGMMILVGAVVAFPAALAGIAVAKTADKLMPVPMRQIGSEPEPEPIPDEQLPSLLLSLAPVVLPVLLISASTILNTIADAEHAARLAKGDVTDWAALRTNLIEAPSPMTPGGRTMQRLRELKADAAVGTLEAGVPTSDDDRARVREALNRVLADKEFYVPAAFGDVLLPRDFVDYRLSRTGDEAPTDAERRRLEAMMTAHGLLSQDRGRMKKVVVERMNRSLLELSFPDAIAPHEWNTPARKRADASLLFGNANLALLLSTAISLFVLWKQRRPTLLEMAKGVETALMSGGAIILITAAGGAFGAMLAAANVGPAIRDLFAGSQGAGLFFLFLGFGIAAVLKIAQGSSTTAMIVASGMLADFVGAVQLPYHAVYLATAIGAGSLVGSWMNDSGFWIFAKMGGLTEVEALKSWTILLLVLAVVSMAMSVVLAIAMPLV